MLNVPQTISQGASLIVTTGANFIVAGGFIINNNLPVVPTVTICNQVWMQSNLNVSTYRNGDPIPQLTNAANWSSSVNVGAWCWYNNDSVHYSSYGKLYNIYAVKDPRGLAPLGWHIPSDSEFTVLSDCLGGEAVAGGKMKEIGYNHWINPNTEANNSSGFTALPAGDRDYNGSFINLTYYAYFWCKPVGTTSTTWYRYLGYGTGNLIRTNASALQGYSVRCIKD